MIDQPNFMHLYGARLLDNGYHIVPIAPGSKAPSEYNPQTGEWRGMPKWDRFINMKPTDFYVDIWSRWPGCGIGIITGYIVGVDIDVMDRAIAWQVFKIIEKHLGKCKLLRVGQEPKMMMVYQTDMPMPKIALKPLECLGFGQQFVAYGIHPKTEKPYEWPMDALVDTPVDHLTMVTQEQVREAMKEAYAILPDEMKSKNAPPAKAELISIDGGLSHTTRAIEDTRGTPEVVRYCAEFLPNESRDWDYWSDVAQSIFNASAGEEWGREIFYEFSARWPGNIPKETAARWKGFKSSPPPAARGVQWLVHKVTNEYGGVIPSDIPFNEFKRAAQDVDISGMLAHKIEPEMQVDEETLVSADAVVEPMPTSKPAAGEKKAPIISAELRAAFPMEWIDSGNGSLVSATCEWILKSARYPHPSLALANTLALMGAIFGRNYHYDGLHMNIMTLGLTESGGGKETSRHCTATILHELEFRAKMVEGRSTIHHLKGPGEFSSGAAVIETLCGSPSVLCNINEFGIILNAITNKRSAQPNQAAVGAEFLKLYSDAGGCTIGKAYAHSKENPTRTIWYPNLCVYGASTISTLTPALSRAEMESGLLSRILLMPALENVPKRQRPAPMALPADLKLRLEQAIIASRVGCGDSEHLAENRPGLKPIEIDDDAWVMLDDIMDRQDVLKDTVGGEIWIRWAENTSKVAMIEAVCINPEKPLITREIMARSIRLVEWSLRYTAELFEREVSDNEHQQKYKKLLKIIGDAGDEGISKSNLQRKTQWMPPHERDKWLADLIDSGQVTSTGVPSTKTGGRPAVYYRLGK